jgi:hypothetical protein
MRRWPIVAAMIVVPVLENADCGWLLMMPPSLSSWRRRSSGGNRSRPLTAQRGVRIG